MISSLSLAKSTGKDFANETVPLSDKISELGLSMLGAASSGATLGFQLGGIKGAILGGVMLSELYCGNYNEDLELFRVDRFN